MGMFRLNLITLSVPEISQRMVLDSPMVHLVTRKFARTSYLSRVVLLEIAQLLYCHRKNQDKVNKYAGGKAEITAIYTEAKNRNVKTIEAERK